MAFVVAVGLGCTKPAPPPKPLPTGQTLRVLSFRGAFAHTTVPHFEQATGNKVALREYRSNEELLALLGRGEPADVIFPASHTVERLLHEGRLRQLAPERVPNLLEIPAEFRNPPYDPGLRHCAPYGFRLLGLGLIMTKSGRNPDSLAALFEPLGPEVAWLDDMRATMGAALRLLGRSASTRQPAEIDAARDLLVRAAPRGVALVDDSAPLLRDGRTGLGLAWSTELLRLASERREVRFVLPREGTLLSVAYVCVPTTATQPELGFAFINHLLSAQVAVEISNEQLLPRLSEGAERSLNGDVRALWGMFESLRLHDERSELLRDVGPAQPQYERAWQAVREAVQKAKAQRPPP